MLNVVWAAEFLLVSFIEGTLIFSHFGIICQHKCQEYTCH